MLFGTDGIRGRVTDSPESDEDAVSQLIEDRTLSPRLLRLVGEALSRTVELGSNVIIGWDNRPRNSELVAALTAGLHLGGCKVTQGGICATPGLHNAIFETNSALGCMITASHNPVSDSGIKVFDSDGFKTYPEIEERISELVTQLAAEDREVDRSHMLSLEKPDAEFDADSAHQELLKIRLRELSESFAHPIQGKLMIDSSKGAAAKWLVDFLCEFGIIAEEISNEAVDLNENCGAGEFNPTDSWTWEEAAKDEHLLIKSLEKCEAGKIVAVALDGDGDRCLFIESTADGVRVVDGDEMADHILRSARGEWILASSIESDLALASSLQRLDAKVEFTQTAVGDRWLAHALKSSNKEKLGVEDSGHLVMSAPNPNGGRCLVGDGVASLLAVLCAMSCENRAEAFGRGFKKRISISPSNRSRWTGDNELADAIEDIANRSLGAMKRGGLVGEANLMLLENDEISIGVRNSGTQAKTNISLRVVPGVDYSAALNAVEEIHEVLKKVLQD